MSLTEVNMIKVHKKLTEWNDIEKMSIKVDSGYLRDESIYEVYSLFLTMFELNEKFKFLL